MPSNAQFFGQQTGQMINDVLGEIGQRRQMKKQSDELRSIFSPQVADTLLQIPEQNRWDAIQSLTGNSIQKQKQEINSANDLAQEGIKNGPINPETLSELVSPRTNQPIKSPNRPKPPIKVGSYTRTSDKKLITSDMTTEQKIKSVPLQPKKLKSTPTSAKDRFKMASVREDGTRLTKKEMNEDQKRIDEQYKPYIKKLSSENDAADFAGPRLNKMKELIKKGNLPVSSIYKILKNIEDHVSPAVGASAGAAIGGALGHVGGIPGRAIGTGAGLAIGAGIGAIVQPVATLLRHGQKWISSDTEAFEKLSAGFLRGAKDIFGGRFTNEEMKAYLESIPTLAQTDKGKLDVIHDMEIFNKAAKIKYKTAQRIIRQNGGRIPSNLQEIVEAESQEQLDQLSDIFREDMIQE